VGGGLRIVQNKSTKEQDDSVTPQTNVEAGQWQKPASAATLSSLSHKRAMAKANAAKGRKSFKFHQARGSRVLCACCARWVVCVACVFVRMNPPRVFLLCSLCAALSTHQSQQDLERALGIPNENPTPAVRGPMEHPKVNASVRPHTHKTRSDKQDFIRPCC